ncbi:MAG TPA: tetratricopeptide repeat protein [Terriglobia bacterium]|nr:tetratricopeptide repeat protein [Terriglobia bacterium]
MLISVQNSYLCLVCQLTYILLLASSLCLAQTVTRSYEYESIAAAYQSGKYQEAEQSLRQILERQPGEIRALSLMGAVLDALKRYEEAEGYYKKALKVSPNSPVLNNNLGNHYLAQGMTGKAQESFMRVVKADPRHVNANLQLAGISVGKKDGQAALGYLGQLPPLEQGSIPFQLLRAQALYWAGQKALATSLIGQIQQRAPGDPRVVFSIGMAYVAMEQFQEAEKVFARALEIAPGNFEILYNLGLAANRAGHLDRAQEILLEALEKKPEDVDTLLGLARVYAEQKKDAKAAPLLVHANRLAPDRTDVLLLMAQVTSNLGFYRDAITAFNKYLELNPNDDIARRERGFSLVRDFKLQEGILDLRRYVRMYPSDPVGYYELGVAESISEKAASLEHFNEALRLDPQFAAARFGRGVLYLDLNQPTRALEDLQQFLEHEPENVRALEQLGRVYLKLEKTQEAAEVLKKAIELAPQDPALYFQYSRAMRSLGRSQEMTDALEKFEKFGGGKKSAVPRRGLIDFFSLDPEQQRARYLAGLEASLRQHPNDSSLKARLAEALLEEGRDSEAIRLFEEIRQSETDGKILARCGHILIEFELYEAARSMLETARKNEGFPKASLLDLALAFFHVAGPEAGLKLLDEVPIPDRNGDYFLLRAQLLDAENRFDEAVKALNESFHANPTRVDLYLQASQFLIKHERYQETIDLLHQASSFIRDIPEIHLTEAVALIFMKKVEEGRKKLTEIQSQWPEWYLPYLINGIYLQNRRQSAEAKPLLETAIALGAKEASAYYYLALVTMELSPNDSERINELISQALRIDSVDPYILSLSGRNALARRDYELAAKYLQEAVRLSPGLIEAHYALSRLYRATGDLAKMEAEEKLTKMDQPGEQIPPTLRDLLFTVRLPAGGEKP